MEQVLSETAKQVPALAVLAVIVWLFLRQMTEARAEYLGTIKQIQSENMEARQHARDAMIENTKVTKETGEAIASLTEVVRHFERK